MAPKHIFITGVTGYIAGTVLHTLAVEKHPEYSYTALVRNEKAGLKIREQIPNVEVVIGDLESFDVLEIESSKADIVINCANNDHTASIPYILRGLSTPFPDEDAGHPLHRFLIHTSGTSILLDESLGTTTTSAVHYNDYENPKGLVHDIPDSAWHREVDQLVLFPHLAPRAPNVHIAIICPPCVYGRGTGTGKIVSWQIPQLIKHFIKRGKGFTVNEGDTVWGNVHVVDLAEIYALLVDHAANQDTSPEVWDGEGGYYLAATGEHHWGDTAQLVAQILNNRGLIKTAELDRLTPEQVRELGAKTGPLEWGCNSRGRAIHAEKVLGWVPQHGSKVLPPHGDKWGAEIGLGLGPHELETEVDMVLEGLC
ncbi:nucleoside-diphosphate-sugar epimerase [Peziza echinospora]|nr:nucleoside-diphosphate-sugar epimerase [Peziza echinospora]